jgi:hypothetical protein
MLGKLLQCDPVAQRMRGSARVRGMRYLYTVLHWSRSAARSWCARRKARVPTDRARARRCS